MTVKSSIKPKPVSFYFDEKESAGRASYVKKVALINDEIKATFESCRV